MYYASLRFGGLEVVEPPFPLGRVDQGTLMRPVHFGRAHFQYAFLFVRTVDIFGTHYSLPSRTHSAFRDADIVISVFEEQFRTFGCRAFVHFPAIVEQCLAVRAHFMDDDGASAQLASSDVGLPVFVPARYILYLVERTPRACRVGGRGHEQPFVRRTYVHPEFAVVIT